MPELEVREPVVGTLDGDDSAKDDSDGGFDEELSDVELLRMLLGG